MSSPVHQRNPMEDKWEFVLSKEWRIKTGKLGKAHGALWKKSVTTTPAILLSVPSSMRPQPRTRARYAHLLNSSVPGMSSWATGTLRLPYCSTGPNALCFPWPGEWSEPAHPVHPTAHQDESAHEFLMAVSGSSGPCYTGYCSLS